MNSVLRGTTATLLGVLVVFSTAAFSPCNGDDLVAPEQDDEELNADQNGAEADDNDEQQGDEETNDGEDSNDGQEANDSNDGNDGEEVNDGDDGDEDEVELTTCTTDVDCLDDEACTQGGHCVNITGERDATTPLQADFDNLDDAAGLGVRYRLPPNARLKIDDIDGDGIGLEVPTALVLEGQGSLLEPEADITALRIGEDGAYSTIRNLAIEHPADAEHDGIGIDIRARGVRLDHLRIEKMGIGVRAHTWVDGVDADVNSQQWSRLVFADNYQAATDISGEHARGGLMQGIEVAGGQGIVDDSQGGNTWLGVAVDDTDDTSLSFGGDQAASTVVGAFVGDDDPDPVGLSELDVYIGGNAIDRFDAEGDRLGMGAGVLSIQYPADSGVAVKIPADSAAPFGFEHPDEDEMWLLHYFEADGLWGMSYGGSDIDVPFGWTGEEHVDGVGLFDMGPTLD